MQILLVILIKLLVIWELSILWTCKSISGQPLIEMLSQYFCIIINWISWWITTNTLLLKHMLVIVWACVIEYFSAWLPDRMNETVRTLSNRIHAITHLNMEMTEDLQVSIKLFLSYDSFPLCLCYVWSCHASVRKGNFIETCTLVCRNRYDTRMPVLLLVDLLHNIFITDYECETKN